MRIVAALLYFVAITCVLAVALSLASHGLTPAVAGLSLLGGLSIAGWAVWRDRTVPVAYPVINGWGWFGIGLWSLFTLRCFLWLIFREGDELKVLSSNNLGDMSIHITFIRYLASGVPFWPDNPICTGAPLTYPVGTDLFNAVLLSVGVKLTFGLTWVGLIGMACTGAAAWRWGGAFVIIGILCNGGVVVFEEWMQPGAKWEFLDYLDQRSWNSIPLALLVTQRGLLFALPATLLLMDKWRTRFLGVPRAGWQLPAWGELVLYATMPLFHLHAFLFLSVALGWWIVAVPAARKDAFSLGMRALIPATFLTMLVTGGFYGHDTIARDFGWTWEAPDAEHPSGVSFIVYLFSNFGVLPFLIAWLVVSLVRNRRDPAARAGLHIAMPALVVFVACFIFRFAPWDWDNSKLIMLAYVVLLPLLWQHCVSRWALPICVVVCFLAFFSGFVSLLGGMSSRNRGHGIASIRTLDTLTSAVSTIPVIERFGTYPTWNHPLLLVGRKVAMGYPGHVFSHGLGDPERERKITSMMNGDPQWRELARNLGVRYIFWGEMEREHYQGSRQPWKSEAERIASGDWGEIYDVSGIRESRE